MTWTLVQKSSAIGVNTTGASAAPALPGSSASGNLLVAVITDADEASTVSGPSGWTLAIQGASAFAGSAGIWYYQDNPGGISSATFTDSNSNLADSWMAEFTVSGVAAAAPDTVGTGTASGSSTCTATATGASTAGDLAVCIFTETLFGAPTWSTPSGWTLLGDDSGTDGGAWSGYLLNASAGTLSVTADSGVSSSWAGSVATFSAGGAPVVHAGAFAAFFS
jgi:hypothetical protein